jgi:hypothetical protein
MHFGMKQSKPTIFPMHNTSKTAGYSFETACGFVS